MATIRIKQGLVEGSVLNGIYSFLGLPYAEPPTGERRWRPACPPPAWEGVRDATRFGKAAIQIVDTGADLGAEASEDCLYLNIWSASLDPSAQQPVMVWIHGGGFLNGSSSMDVYSGQNLARRGVVVVSLNYRLGAFGFLRHPEAGGNFAVSDWVAALKWVSENVKMFGGHPQNVTIFGQSAGAVAVRTLLCTPAARGLFHRAIIQSAGFEDYAATPSPNAERVNDTSEKFFKLLGSQDLDVLRRIPAEKIQVTSLTLCGARPPPGYLHSPANLVWYPVPDDEVVMRDFSGWDEQVPVLFGCTQHEARAFWRPTGLHTSPGQKPSEIYTVETLANMSKVLARGGDQEMINYFSNGKFSPYQALTELCSAAIWMEPAKATYHRFSALNRKTYFFIFSRISPATRHSGMLAYHGAEIPYIFGNVSRDGFLKPWFAKAASAVDVAQSAIDKDFDTIDIQIANDVQNAWATFAQTGIPRFSDGSAWPQCDANDMQLTVIGDRVEAKHWDMDRVVNILSSLRDQTRD
ncbi:Carboxylesterase [Trichoderma velutinum]